VILLKNEGIAHNTIGKIMGLCKNTVRKYIKEYLSGGLERLKELHYFRRKSELEDYSEIVKKYFEGHPPRSTQEACDAITKLTGLIRKPTQVRAFLKKLGMKYQKVGSIPKRADVEMQEAFKKKSWSHG
jgi:transposase